MHLHHDLLTMSLYIYLQCTYTMLLNILPRDWPGSAGDTHIITMDDIKKELGLDYEERLNEAIRREIESPFHCFNGHHHSSTSNNNDTYESMTADVLDHLFSDDHNDAIFNDWYNYMDEDIFNEFREGEGEGEGEGETGSARKKRAPNLYPYEFGDVHKANWHRNYLADDVRERTRTLSKRDRYGEFRSHFRVTLDKMEELVELFLSNGWIRRTQHCRDDHTLRVKAELLILSCLKVLSHATPFRCLTNDTNISFTEHRLFFHKFIEKMCSMRDEYVHLPRNNEELKQIMSRYDSQYLPGCIGSKDVVHTKWSCCPAGDYNRAKGKESFPSIAFQCITDFDRRILGVSSAQHGSRNDKHIVKIDHNVAKIRDDWYSHVSWTYFTSDGDVNTDVGVYLICDNGYCRWPVSICPFQSAAKDTLEGYFSTNLESVRKDVECVFGILKKRWRILDYGLRFRSMATCENVFVTCCILHNMMLDEMDRDQNAPRAQHGQPLPGEGLWIRGPGAPPTYDPAESDLAHKWGKRRMNLARHLEYVKRRRL